MDIRKEQVIEIMMNLLKKEGRNDFLEDNSDLTDIDLNSLIFIKFVVELEDKFNITFDEERLDYNSFSNLNELTKYINSICSRNVES